MNPSCEVRHACLFSALAWSIVAASSTSTAADTSAAAPRAAVIVAPDAYAKDDKLGDGCWARLYRAENYGGDVLTLIGPVDVDYLSRDWGFRWDPRYHSLAVGPAATLTTFDDAHLRDKTAVFESNRRIADLDRHMGVFRSIRSMKVTCS